MPGRHGRPDDDETTAQAYYGQDEEKTVTVDYGHGARGPTRRGATPPPQPPQQPPQPAGAPGRPPQTPPAQGGPPPAQPPSAPAAALSAPPPAPAPAAKRKKWPWVVGAVVLLFVIIGVANQDSTAPTAPAAGGGQPASSAAPAPAAPSAPPASSAPASGGIVYEVTGKGRAGNITYSSNGAGGISQQNDARLPFRKQLPASDELFGVWTLSAQNGQGSGTISCKITKDGEVLNENTSEGPYAVVTCTGS